MEHLKRYTTLGMATDQGKTSNLNGLALMANITGRTIPEVGTTTYRPPFTPVPIASFTGKRSGNFFNPVRRLPLENAHRADGAVVHLVDLRYRESAGPGFAAVSVPLPATPR